MRRMSFSLTERQLLDGTKTVTRRLGWANLRPGQKVLAVRKTRGLRKGERQEPLAVIVVRDVRRERLDAITAEDVVREGFPDLSPDEFVTMFCEHMRCDPTTYVTRIEFERIGGRGRTACDAPGVRPPARAGQA